LVIENALKSNSKEEKQQQQQQQEINEPTISREQETR
jgi:hypothetical protein